MHSYIPKVRQVDRYTYKPDADRKPRLIPANMIPEHRLSCPPARPVGKLFRSSSVRETMRDSRPIEAQLAWPRFFGHFIESFSHHAANCRLQTRARTSQKPPMPPRANHSLIPNTDYLHTTAPLSLSPLEKPSLCHNHYAYLSGQTVHTYHPSQAERSRASSRGRIRT